MSVFADLHALKSPRSLLEAAGCPPKRRLAVLERPYFPNLAGICPSTSNRRASSSPRDLVRIKAEERATRVTNAIDADARREEPAAAVGA